MIKVDVLNKMNVPPFTAGSHIATGLQNTSGQQIMAGPRYSTVTNTPLPSPPGSELPLQSATLQQAQGHGLTVPHTAPAPSGYSVIESEIIMPDEESDDSRASSVHDASHLRGPPVILNEVRLCALCVFSIILECFGLNCLFC